MQHETDRTSTVRVPRGYRASPVVVELVSRRGIRPCDCWTHVSGNCEVDLVDDTDKVVWSGLVDVDGALLPNRIEHAAAILQVLATRWSAGEGDERDYRRAIQAVGAASLDALIDAATRYPGSIEGPYDLQPWVEFGSDHELTTRAYHMGEPDNEDYAPHIDVCLYHRTRAVWQSRSIDRAVSTAEVLHHIAHTLAPVWLSSDFDEWARRQGLSATSRNVQNEYRGLLHEARYLGDAIGSVPLLKLVSLANKA